MLVLLGILLSLGAINAMIPILIILVLLVAAAGLNRGYSLFNFFGLSTLAGINPGGKASIAGKTGFNFAAAFINPNGIGATTRLGSRVVARVGRRMGRSFMSRTGSRSIMRDIKNAEGKATPRTSPSRFATRWPRISKIMQTAKGSKTWQMSKKVGEGLLYKPIRATVKDIRGANAARGGGSNSRLLKTIGKAYQVSKSKINAGRERVMKTAPFSGKIKMVGTGHDVRAPKPKISVLGEEGSKNRKSLGSFLNTAAAIAFPGYTLLRATGRQVSKAVEARKLATGRRPPKDEKERKSREYTLSALSEARTNAASRVEGYGGYSNMTKAQARGVKREARQKISGFGLQQPLPSRFRSRLRACPNVSLIF